MFKQFFFLPSQGPYVGLYCTHISFFGRNEAMSVFFKHSFSSMVLNKQSAYEATLMR